jgi:hypothetical protein
LVIISEIHCKYLWSHAKAQPWTCMEVSTASVTEGSMIQGTHNTKHHKDEIRFTYQCHHNLHQCRIGLHHKPKCTQRNAMALLGQRWGYAEAMVQLSQHCPIHNHIWWQKWLWGKNRILCICGCPHMSCNNNSPLQGAHTTDIPHSGMHPITQSTVWQGGGGGRDETDTLDLTCQSTPNSLEHSRYKQGYSVKMTRCLNLQ